MSRSLSYLRRGLLGIAFVGSMGFGVSQALAAPVSAKVAACTAEERSTCRSTCLSMFGPGATYRCYVLGAGPTCECQPA